MPGARDGMIHGEKELDRLEAVLDALAEGHDGMTIPEFDGFVAGLIVSPEPIPATEWLSELWDAGPVFEDGEAAQRALTNHYQGVAQVLADDPESYAPVFDADAHTAEVFWGAWIVGFGRAMGLRREAWDRIVQGDDLDAAACANLMRVMYAFVKGESNLSPEVAEELGRKAPRMIPEAVVDLNAWTKPPRCGAGRPGGASRRAWLVPVATRDDNGTVGRNEPCPCGTGRKYKHCCGAH